MPTVTPRQLNRATLARQLLLGRERLNVVQGVHRVMALQAQEPASPYLALWNRLVEFDAGDLDRAFADHAIVKASLMRMTLHAVDVADYPAFHAAMTRSLRAARLGDDRFTAYGLSAADADVLLPDVLTFVSVPRTNAEVDAFLLERAKSTAKGGLWWAFRTFAPLFHAPTGGPWSFGPRPSYTAAKHRGASPPAEDGAKHLVRRYLEAFGPASVADVAEFSVKSRGIIRSAIDALGDELVTLDGPGGTTLHDLPGGTLPAEDTPAPTRLLPMWDSLLLGYRDRSRVIPADYRRRVIHQNGDVLPTLLVDGFVAGVWRPADGGIEATSFHKLSRADWHGLEEEAAALVVFLADRDPQVYRRYGHWWAKAPPGAEVRVLGT